LNRLELPFKVFRIFSERSAISSQARGRSGKYASTLTLMKDFARTSANIFIQTIFTLNQLARMKGKETLKLYAIFSRWD